MNLNRSEKLTLWAVILVIALVVSAVVYLEASRSADRAEAERKYLSTCEYVGSRIERYRTVYRYDCNGIIEETFTEI